MPNYLVVRCCNCNIFQVQQENKKRKFSCKICNYKQSVLRIYLESTNPSNCRAHVQECNTKIIPLLEEKKKLKSILNYGDYDEKYQKSKNRTIDSYFKKDKEADSKKNNNNDYEYNERRESHWNIYLSDSENDTENEDVNSSNKEQDNILKKDNLTNEREEELARNLIEKIAESILKTGDNDTYSSEEEEEEEDSLNEEDETENKHYNITETQNNNRNNNYNNNINNNNININEKSQIYIRNRKLITSTTNKGYNKFVNLKKNFPLY
ncbi:hypothetical protein BCR32DRAFT_268236 [Anaeromyces robustus]|uniref:MRN complex-interacting protein N-terminal domain-containing protein n=1 Tax=Anaeromyces robustus TaxID=1754192 RepID=A0A1Y1X6Z2_9FUNG|nr:hypothetical protein BCR32DRAFT_268236 [Anaeromyces robustus]|eukprot:ORX81563.1 hypothetical protein BCR32DRAFT_268236 [Anaeromyces robustus]